MIGMGDGGTLYLQLHGTFGIWWTELILHTFCVLPIKSDTCLTAKEFLHGNLKHKVVVRLSPHYGIVNLLRCVILLGL